MHGDRCSAHWAASSATLLAQDSQKRACPRGTKANPCRGSTRHTSQQSSGASAAAAADAEVGADDAVATVDARTVRGRTVAWTMLPES